MSKNEFDKSLYIKLFSEMVSTEEAEYIIQYLQESKEHRLDYFQMKRIWQESRKRVNKAGLEERSWERLKIRIEESENEDNPIRGSRLQYTWKRITIAASIMLLIGISGYWVYHKHQTSLILARELHISAPKGSRSHVELPDGSDVWLNSGSQLTYYYDTERADRKVTLSGEAYFDIEHTRNIPFIVNTSDLEIKVLGTKFNVKSYPEEQFIETTLIEGKIEVYKINGVKGAAAIAMEPNQKLIYQKKEMIADVQTPLEQLEPEKEIVNEEIREMSIKIVKKINSEEDASWKDGKLIIRSETLEVLAIKLERYYNVSISFKDESIREFSYSGTLNEVTIEEVLRALEKTSPIQFSIKKDQVVLALRNKN